MSRTFIVCTIFLAMASAAFADSSDTLYCWDFPSESWTPAGNHWTGYDDFVRADLYVEPPDFEVEIDQDALVSPELSYPAGCDSLLAVLNYDTVIEYSCWAGNVVVSGRTSLILHKVSDSVHPPVADTIWTESAGTGHSSSDTVYFSGPVAVPIQSVSPGDQFYLELSCRAYATTQYGWAWLGLQWDVEDLVLLVDNISALQSATWGSIKSSL